MNNKNQNDNLGVSEGDEYKEECEKLNTLTLDADLGVDAGVDAGVDTGVDAGVDDEDIIKDAFETFDEMGLTNNILHGIYAHGFEKPSQIQKYAIVPITQGRDIIAQSQSGTGKTATFLIGMMANIIQNEATTQALIVCPTRELAKQIHGILSDLARYTDITSALLIGGTQRLKYSQGHGNNDEMAVSQHVVVGTPGRILEYFHRKRIDPDNVKMLILDEADEMLSRGFQEQIREVIRALNTKCQVCLFSATMPPEMLELTQHFMVKPMRYLIKNAELTLEGIRQFYVFVERADYKLETLCDLYGLVSATQSMIYCNSKRRVAWLASMMRERQFTVSCITGGMMQDERNQVMDEFRNGKTRVLICTDVLSRGIDVQQVSLILNYELPMERETYIHRIGRSGRFGRKGVAINLIGRNELNDLKTLEQFYHTQIEELPANLDELI